MIVNLWKTIEMGRTKLSFTISVYYYLDPAARGKMVSFIHYNLLHALSRCNFMNFARNFKCLECEEARPKRQLTGGEWECPQ